MRRNTRHQPIIIGKILHRRMLRWSANFVRSSLQRCISNSAIFNLRKRDRNFFVAGLPTSADLTDADLVTSELSLTDTLTPLLTSRYIGDGQDPALVGDDRFRRSGRRYYCHRQAVTRTLGPWDSRTLLYQYPHDTADQRMTYETRCRRRENKQRHPVGFSNLIVFQ